MRGRPRPGGGACRRAKPGPVRLRAPDSAGARAPEPRTFHRRCDRDRTGRTARPEAEPARYADRTTLPAGTERTPGDLTGGYSESTVLCRSARRLTET